MIRLHNTLGNKIEEFKPIKPGVVGMYHCGPTVYDFVHIGNLRAFFVADLVRRVFEYEGYKVKQVMNITDVGIGGDNDEGEDKMIKGLKREGKKISMESMKELSEFYTEKFKEDIRKLNIKVLLRRDFKTFYARIYFRQQNLLSDKRIQIWQTDAGFCPRCFRQFVGLVALRKNI